MHCMILGSFSFLCSFNIFYLNFFPKGLIAQLYNSFLPEAMGKSFEIRYIKDNKDIFSVAILKFEFVLHIVGLNRCECQIEKLRAY